MGCIKDRCAQKAPIYINDNQAYARSFNLDGIFGIRIVIIASGDAYHNICCNHIISASCTCLSQAIAISLCIKNNHGRINNANAIVLIRYIIWGSFLYMDM